MARLGRRLGYTRIVGIWCKTPLAVCLERNRTRPRRVPDFVLYSMYKRLDREPPSLQDGFDALKIVAPKRKPSAPR